jgi:hypothetical protein
VGAAQESFLNRNSASDGTTAASLGGVNPEAEQVGGGGGHEARVRVKVSRGLPRLPHLVGGAC